MSGPLIELGPGVQAPAAPRGAYIPISRPTIGHDEIAGATEVLESGWITTGAKVDAFEDALRDFTGARHAVALNSGTAALHLALLAAGIGPGDEVITTPLTFVATANAIRHVGATPVFADIDRDSLNLDSDAVDAAITARTRAILPVHFAGRPCALDALRTIAHTNGLRIIEDAAHALGARHRDGAIGSIGDVTCFSFHPNKNITTIEGGALTTDDDTIAQRVRRLRFHGIAAPGAWQRRRLGPDAPLDVDEPGFKYNLSDVSAVIGLGQLGRLEGFLSTRAELVDLYWRELAGVPALRLPPAVDEIARHAWNMFTPLIRVEELSCDRSRVMAELHARDVGSAVHYPLLHTLSAYVGGGSRRAGPLTDAEYVGPRILTLPLFPTMSPDVCAMWRAACERFWNATPHCLRRRTAPSAARRK